MAPQKKPLVSILMNCYNGEEYLRQAIESILAQSYINWEVIFWDNCSTDSSAQLYKEILDPRLKYFLGSEHVPLYEARNNALGVANGELIAFLDVDDAWCPTKLERQIALFEDPSVDVVYTNYETINVKKNKRFVTHKGLKSGRILGELLKTYQVGILTLMLRARVLNNLSKKFDSRFQIYGDYDLILRLSVNHNIVAIDEPLATYVLHGKNLYRSDYSRNVCELQKLIESFAITEPEIVSNINFKYVLQELEWMKFKCLGRPTPYNMLKYIYTTPKKTIFLSAFLNKLLH